MELKDFEDYKNSPENERREYFEYSEAQRNLVECEKIKAEAIETGKPFYKKPSFFISITSTLIPSVLAILAFYGTNAKDFFQNKVREIELNKRELNLQIERLEQTKSKLVQDSLNLLEWHEIRKIELNKEYGEKEIELEQKYQKKITLLESEVDIKNDAIENQLIELRNTEKSKESLKEELKKSLNSEKSKNELITRLQNENKTLESKYKRALQDNDDALAVTESLQREIENFKDEELKNEILVYLLSKGWVRVGFNRIRQDINPSIDNAKIQSIIKENSNIFSITDLNDINDPKGLRLKEKLTTDDIIK